MKIFFSILMLALLSVGTIQAQSSSVSVSKAEAVEATAASDVIPASAVDATGNDEMKAKSCSGKSKGKKSCCSSKGSSGKSCCSAKASTSTKGGCSGHGHKSTSASIEETVPEAKTTTEVTGRDEE